MPTQRGRRLIYARPSFLEGMARVLDIGGTLEVYYTVPVGAKSDEEATLADLQRAKERVQAEKAAVQAEKAAVEAGSKRAYLGLATGFIISLLMIAAGAYAIIWGNNPWLGVAVIAAQNALFVGLFIYVTNARRRERERKAADVYAGRDW